MNVEPTTPGNALTHALVAILEAANGLSYAALEAIDNEDHRRLVGAAPGSLTEGLALAVEVWRDTLAEVEPFLIFIGEALAAAPLDPDDAAEAQTLAALSAPAQPFQVTA